MITPEGDYLSNLTAPDLRSYFKHLHWRAMPHSMGHLVASDWADKSVDDPVFGLYKNCGLWTRDEAAILYNWALRVRGEWVDIGAHTGWTTRHIQSGCGSYCYPVDPMHTVNQFRERYQENMGHHPDLWVGADMPSSWYFAEKGNAGAFASGFCIDGDHEPGKPLEDACNAAQHLAGTGVIIFHDGTGKPVRDAVVWLLDRGFKARVYWTPHIVIACWRGDIKPVNHVRDDRIDWTGHEYAVNQDIGLERLS